MKVCLVFGTRPEIIKLAPLIYELQKRKIDFKLIHTGQHYSENMDAIFWRYFKLPPLDFQLHVRQPTHATQTAEMLIGLEKIFVSLSPDWVIVHGDTNSTLSGALAARKIAHVRIAHVEAGLRSFDRSMPEEINRILVDQMSDLLFAPTVNAQMLLQQAGIPLERIFVTGNTIEDILRISLQRAELESQILKTLELEQTQYVLLTIHRQENTDDQERLERILNACFQGATDHGLEVVFPIHPRTKDRLLKNQFRFPNHVHLAEPLGYDDFLILEKNANILATDSGGLQEEACILNVPCLTLRENTERPETVSLGANLLVGTEPADIRRGFATALRLKRQWQSPYGGGLASVRIVDAILSQNGMRKIS